MRLSINGWHPVASHLMCLIAGVAMTNTLGHSRSEPAFAKEELTFTVNQDLVATNLELSDEPVRAALVKTVQDRPICRLFKAPLNIMRMGSKLQFATKIQEQAGLGALMKELRIKGKVVATQVSREHQNLPLCRIRPRISYGG